MVAGELDGSSDGTVAWENLVGTSVVREVSSSLDLEGTVGGQCCSGGSAGRWDGVSEMGRPQRTAQLGVLWTWGI